MEILIFIAILALIYFIIFVTYIKKQKPSITYTHEYFIIKTENLKNVPKWLKYCDTIEIKKTTEITNKKKGNDVKYSYDINLGEFGEYRNIDENGHAY